jgi:hypothetical protein
VQDRLSEEAFKAHLGETFTLVLDSGATLELELAETGRYPAQPASTREVEGREITIRPDPFWLVFRGPRQPALPQRLYVLAHEKMGRIEGLFLVPCAEDASGRRYHVVVN